jgi:signal peptidase I
MYQINSKTMEPTVSKGDCLIATPLYNAKPDASAKVSLLIPAKRGDLVVIEPAYQAEASLPGRVLDRLVAFLTFQKWHPFERRNTWGEKPVVRRLVALPGDSIYMDQFVLHVRPAASAHFLTEFELSEKTYDIQLDQLPKGWGADMPFSGSFPQMTLGNNEFFVLCDNRINASDSRVWGPVTAQRIHGKVVLRYWPLSHFGRP